jgi:hypothetical protein
VLAGAVGVLFHGLAFLVCLVPLLWAVDTVLRGLRGHRAVRNVALRSAALDVVVAAAVVIAAELVMPGTLSSALEPLRRAAFVGHHGGAPWHVAEGQDALPLIAVATSVLACLGLGSLAREGRVNFADAAILGLLALPGLVWSRFSAVPLLATFPWAIAGVAALFARGLASVRSPLRAGLAIATGVMVIGIAGFDVALEGLGADVGGYDFRKHPKRAIEWTRTNLPNASLFHANGQGAYLIYAHWLPSGVVLDARGPLLYGAEYAARYDDVLAAPARFEVWAREAGFDAVLVTHSNSAAKRFNRWFEGNPSWSVAYLDDRATVYVAVRR